MILQDRITELTLKGIGTIRAAVKQAESDALAVAKLKERVENQSATVDLVAKEASKAKEISEEVAEKNQILDKTITKATDTLEDLEAATEFMMIVIAAQIDDRKAFDELKKRSEDKTYRFSTRAQQAWQKILDEHASPLYISGFAVPWKEGVDHAKLGLAKLREDYNSSPPYVRRALVEYIWNRSDISKKDRMQFLVDVLKEDSSLQVVECAGRLFTQESKQNKKPLAVEYLLQWWEEHKKDYN